MTGSAIGRHQRRGRACSRRLWLLALVAWVAAVASQAAVADSNSKPAASAAPQALQGQAEPDRGTGFEVRWQAISAGGGAASSPSFDLRGSIGQHSASADHPATGSTFSHKGGFWPILRARVQALIDRVFQDSFE